MGICIFKEGMASIMGKKPRLEPETVMASFATGDGQASAASAEVTESRALPSCPVQTRKVLIQ
jgi:hypothetical protein